MNNSTSNKNILPWRDILLGKRWPAYHISACSSWKSVKTTSDSSNSHNKQILSTLTTNIIFSLDQLSNISIKSDHFILSAVLNKKTKKTKCMYRASHIILDFLQSLTPKFAHNTRKIKHFLQKKKLLTILNFLNDSFFLNFWFVPQIII